MWIRNYKILNNDGKKNVLFNCRKLKTYSVGLPKTNKKFIKQKPFNERGAGLRKILVYQLKICLAKFNV